MEAWASKKFFKGWIKQKCHKMDGLDTELVKTNWVQRVVTNSSILHWVEVSSRSPKGPTLSSIQFNIFIYYLKNKRERMLIKFAGILTHCRIGIKIECKQDKFFKWAEINKIRFNKAFINVMWFTKEGIIKCTNVKWNHRRV